MGFVDVLAELQPDIVLLLGDRGEMLAAAIAALHLNIPIVHIHGGERSGTVDEPIRHAISKLAHLHLVATGESQERLVRMGESPERVIVVGAPGLDGLEQLASIGRDELFARHNLRVSSRLALLVYHPVVQEAQSAGKDALAIIDALEQQALQVLALRPNSDAGSAGIVDVLDTAARKGRISLVTHLQRCEYVSLLKHADVLVGNSSSGIIEAASFGTPVVNIGSRQSFRERNANVCDVAPEAASIVAALDRALAHGHYPPLNRYGDGKATPRIIAALSDLAVGSPALLTKTNAY
jgi:GDP/UDP-N,N'-diacetylbacillosamine 2-epimerase (hydrolysing)